MEAQINLEEHKLGTLPSLYLVENFINEAMELQLLTNITSSKSKWQEVSGRKLQSWGGTLSKQGVLIPSPIPHWLSSVMTTVSTSTNIYGDQPANHVLVNSYEAGEGILSHQDGPCYFPAVAILSLGAPAVMHFTAKRDAGGEENGGTNNNSSNSGQKLASVVLPQRSLLIFKDEAYSSCLHGIDAIEKDIFDETVVNPGAMPGGSMLRQGTRVSLTIRRVPRVLKGFLGGGGGLLKKPA